MSPTSAVREDAYNTIEVLARVWPSKRTQIIIEIRKILAELNISFESKSEDQYEKFFSEEPAYPRDSRQ
jgi:hypothetical protein